MKKHKISLLLAPALSLLLVGCSSSAHNVRSPGIDARIRNQLARIDQGIHRGDLTRFEARRLLRRLNEIREMKRQFLSDGHLDYGERARLLHALEHNSQLIYRLRHNNRTRS